MADRRDVEIRIDSLASSGEGVGRAPDGRVVFVPDTAPGDRALVEIVSSRKRHARGRVRTLLEPGEARTDPVCPVFGSCGGCAWQHVEYEAQLEAKQRILADALARIGGIAVSEVPIVRSPDPYGYRRRARVFAETGRVGFRRRRSHAICATTVCAVLTPGLQSELEGLASNPPVQKGEWELLAGDDGAVRRAAVGHSAHGASPVFITIGDDRLRVSTGVFVQAHAGLLEPLTRAVCVAAGEGSRVWEVFAGAGFFTLGLARRFARVVAIESDRDATRDLAHNADAAGCTNVDVIHTLAEDALHDPASLGPPPDVVVLDPPRTGLSTSVVDGVLGAAPNRIVLVSCDAATLARDLARFAAGGFALVTIRCFDLFPQTPHVESISVLERATGSASVSRDAGRAASRG